MAGKPIVLEKERQVRQMLREGVAIKEISRRTKVNVKTIRAIRAGRQVNRSEPLPARTKPYACHGCSEAAGYRVEVSYRPCVACVARKAREESLSRMRLGIR